MYALVGILALVLFMPQVSFAQQFNIVNMFMHEEISNSFSSSLEDQERSMALVTNNKSYKIQVLWEPTEIKPNQIVRFDIAFLNYITNEPVSNVHYDFVVIKDEWTIKEIRNSFAINGIATHTVEFPSTGSFNVTVNVLGIGEFGEPQNESITFDLKVVPEFPLSTVIVMASVVGIMIALTRFSLMNRRTNINPK